MFRRKNPAQLQQQLASLKGGSSFSNEDKNEWKLKTDNAGNGQAVIRFLPGKDENSLPFVKLINHGFKHAGKWYIENCTSTHGDFDSCPVCAHLSKNDSYNSNPAEYKLLKRKTSFWSNILVIKDPANPENEGKVFKFRFGQKIMDKINAMVEVDVDMGETPVDVTCVYEGANFVMKVKKVGGFQNYDECKFLGQSEIANINDEETQKFLTENMADLSEIVAPSQFKSFEVNEAKFKQIMGTAALGGAAAKAAAQADKIGDDLDSFDKDLSDFESKPTSSRSADDIMGDAGDSVGDDDLNDILNDL